MRLSTLLIAALTGVSALPAQAIIAQNSGLANPTAVIDFGANLFPNFTPVSTEFAGITITHARYFTTGVSTNLVGGFLTNDPIGGPDTLRIQFAFPISDLSFVYHQIGTFAPSTIRAMSGGVTVDSFSGTWNQSQLNNYFGFTNIVFDELQIDFVGDFNVDTLAYNPSSAAHCIVHNGTGINPLTFACTTLPVLGTTWVGDITLTPNTVLTLLAFTPGPAGAPIPLFGGEYLLQPAPPPSTFIGLGNYSFPIPTGGTWIGTSVVLQGFRLDDVAGQLAIVPVNANELVLGL